MEPSPARDAERLLAALDSSQQKMLDLIATAFFEEGGQWPVFEYLEVEFDAEGWMLRAPWQASPETLAGSTRRRGGHKPLRATAHYLMRG